MFDYAYEFEFPSSKKVSLDRLTLEIKESEIPYDFELNMVEDELTTLLRVLFKEELDSAQVTALGQLVTDHSGEPVIHETTIVVKQDAATLDAKGRTVVVPSPRTGRELTVVSHNFCDPTTWFSTSECVSETLTPFGDTDRHFAGSFERWVDMTHGKVFDEDAIALDVPHGYLVIVRKDGVELAQRAPFASSGGDYTVDYLNGAIVLAEPAAGAIITAEYSRVVDSTFVLVPDPGSKLAIETVETQFSTDVIMNDTIDFSIWAYNPADLPNKVMLGRTSYKTFRNMIDEALGSYPVVPAIGGANGRGTNCAIYGFPFRYGTIRELDAAYGVELRVKLRDDLPFGGEHATATFYTTVT